LTVVVPNGSYIGDVCVDSVETILRITMMRTYMIVRDVVIGLLGGVSVAVLCKAYTCGTGWMVL